MNIEFTARAWEVFNYWIETDIILARKIKELTKSIQQEPFRGLGKPEPLRHQLKGLWARRITKEHILVYKIVGKKGVDQKCIILQCRYHYEK